MPCETDGCSFVDNLAALPGAKYMIRKEAKQAMIAKFNFFELK
jgi:hypothetical protein